MSGKGEKGEWKTINGAHIYIADGQSVEEAMDKQFHKKQPKNQDSERLKKILSERGQSEDEDFAKDTGYFGYGSLDELEKAHNAGYKKSIDQDKSRDDKYTTGNPDNINKQSSIADIDKTLSDYKGSGSVDLVLPGGKWGQIRPQKDGTYLVRSNNGQKYVSTADEAKKELSATFNPSSQNGNTANENKSVVNNSTSDRLRSNKVQELMKYGYSKEQSEQAFEAAIEFWQKQLNCDREKAIQIVAKDNG